jgi:hypothetical protein
MRTYKTEFSKYDDELSLPDGWIDTSWHNDVSPSFQKQFGDITYRIWCDYKDSDRREVGGKQFTVATYDSNEFEELQDLAEFDTLQEALDFVSKETTQ